MTGKIVAVIEGDGAAPEAVRPSVELIGWLAPEIEWRHPLLGQQAISLTGEAFPEASRKLLDTADATLFGATGGSAVAALFYLRWGLGTYANVRPIRYLPGARSPLNNPQDIDFVIVRENLEDAYVLCEGPLEKLAPLDLTSPTTGKRLHEMGKGAYAIKAITRDGSERVIRHAFELARTRRKHLSVTSKHNMLSKTDGLFMQVARKLATAYPDVRCDTFIIDDFAHQLVTRPEQFDVVVMPNLYGDIMSDCAVGLIGGLGMGPSGCYGERHAYFEPSHGTAPDLVGKNCINPTATLLSGVMMLDHLGLATAARRLEHAVATVFAEGQTLTPDQGGSASTTQFCDAVRRHC